MKDELKTKQQLIDEIRDLRQRVEMLEAAEPSQGSDGEVSRQRPGQNDSCKGTEQLQEIIDNTLIIILVKDITGRYLIVNSAFESLSGKTRDAVIGKRDSDIFPPEYRDLIAEDDRTVVGSKTRLSREVSFPIGEEVRTYIVNKFPLFDGSGNVCAVCETYLDITERKRAEEKLRKSEKALRDVTSSLAEGIYVVNEQGHIIFMNEEAERLLGWTEAELRHKNAHALVHYQKADGTPLPFEECPMHKVIKTGERFFSQDEVFVRRDGTIFPISVLTSPLMEEGRVVASVTAFRDITERKGLERELLQAQKLESIGFLAGGIAHDFNNLLQAIVGNISLAKMFLNPQDRVWNLLNRAESACDHAKDLSYRLLTFSKGGEPFKRTVFMKALLRDTVRFSLSGSNVISEFSIADDLSPVNIDEGQMRQVITNLVNNAKEAMPGEGRIRVCAGNITVTEKDNALLKEGNYLKISIEDNGIGIPKENLAKIFDPYFTTKDLGSRKGSGLGLAICHSIIKKHDGLITVESKEGIGTTFHIYLPASEKHVIRGGNREERQQGRRGRVLLMDDDKRTRDIAGEMLTYLGYEVEYASNGEEAIALYRRGREGGQPFDTVILDLTIPGGIGGKTAIKRLHEIDPEAKAIVSSGYADDPIMTNFGAYGFAGAITKPYTVHQLHEILTKVKP